MANSPPNLDLDQPTSRADATLAKALAPEEIRPGDYVALLNIVYELPSFLWCDDAALMPREQPVRIQFTPESGSAPLKVKSVCLPYVLVKHPAGRKFTLDVRRSKLARLGTDFAEVAWESLKSQRSKKKKRR
jgi:hypothetical protein